MTEITINNNTQPVDYWQKQLETVLDPGWFDTIAKAIQESGNTVDYRMAKRKACYIRVSRTHCHTLWNKWYKEDFGKDMPLTIDGKSWQDVIKHEMTNYREGDRE